MDIKYMQHLKPKLVYVLVKYMPENFSEINCPFVKSEQSFPVKL
jgi:hypothetical protein